MEMDPWVVAEVLDPNLAVTGFQNQAVVHTSPVETLLEQAAENGGMLVVPDSVPVHVACSSTLRYVSENRILC